MRKIVLMMFMLVGGLAPLVAHADEVDPSIKKAIATLGSNDLSAIASSIGGIGGCAEFGDQECQGILIKLWHREDIDHTKINYNLVDKERTFIAGFMVSMSGKFREEAIQYLYATTKSPNTGDRADAYFRLYKIGDKKAVNALEKAVSNDVPVVAHDALEALNLIAHSKKSGAKDAQLFLSTSKKIGLLKLGGEVVSYSDRTYTDMLEKELIKHNIRHKVIMANGVKAIVLYNSNKSQWSDIEKKVDDMAAKSTSHTSKEKRH